jgi:pimeloyl-ACP methyl ester carboxylesterase
MVENDFNLRKELSVTSRRSVLLGGAGTAILAVAGCKRRTCPAPLDEPRMSSPDYWKRYPVETDPDEIAAHLRTTRVLDDQPPLELIHFEAHDGAPAILISQGTAGHGYVFAELGYRMNAYGYHVFIMPKHGGRTIEQLLVRHARALQHIARAYTERIGVFAEGLGGYAAFYLALDHGPFKSLVCQNSPAILTEERFQRAMTEGSRQARRRRAILPLARSLAKTSPCTPLRISRYLDFEDLVDPSPASHAIEARMIHDYLRDPDFDRRYPVSAIMSLLETPPPRPLGALEMPTMFIVPERGIVPTYFDDLFSRLPAVEKRLVHVDGSVFWMVSHPRDAARLVCDWFDRTV